MNGSGAVPASSRQSSDGPAGSRRYFEPAQRRQIAWITAVAVVIFVVLRWLPTGTNLSHMDFRVNAKDANAIEFCDPLNPQFIPVVAMKSPVVMTLTHEPVAIGTRVRCIATLRTASGKAIAPEDLLVAHTKRLHLLIVDPTLQDYQHVHPEPGKAAGAWEFEFTPRLSGTYRVFADFTPAATARGLYASADLAVQPGAADMFVAKTAEQDGYRFGLSPDGSLHAGQPIDLKFVVTRLDGGAVPMEPVMGAYAHLVAFDGKRSGFAHLHPAEADVTRKPHAHRPELNFKLTIPQPGRYVIWAQVNLGGREEFVPFSFEVK